MDGYQFIASMLQSFASLGWPIAFVIAVWLLREKLSALLPRLRMKYGGVDVSFTLDQAEKEAAQIPKAPPSPDLDPTPEEKNRYEKLAEYSPRAAILEKRADLEQTLRTVAEPLLSSKGPRPWKTIPLTAAIRLLRSHGVIDENTSALLVDLRNIGNRAAHSADNSEFTRNEALRFGKLADDLIARIGWLG